jgi:hypothetical protein
MFKENQTLFDEFTKIHDLYKTDDSKYQKEFNQIGEKVTEVIREWERRLCQYSEKGNNAVYSKNLSEKFWAEIRSVFTHIDLVGCE